MCFLNNWGYAKEVTFLEGYQVGWAPHLVKILHANSENSVAGALECSQALVEAVTFTLVNFPGEALGQCREHSSGDLKLCPRSSEGNWSTSLGTLRWSKYSPSLQGAGAERGTNRWAVLPTSVAVGAVKHRGTWHQNAGSSSISFCYLLCVRDPVAVEKE